MAKTVELEEGRYRVPMSVLSEFVESPFEWCPWDCPLFTEDEVRELPEDMSCDVPYDDQTNVRDMVVGQSSYHIARIAYLVRHQTVLDEYDYPVFSTDNAQRGLHALLDGNHRYGAAIIRGDEFFIVDIDGDIDYARELFDV
jgi:hypothetical protein